MTLAETAAAGHEMGTGHRAEITRSHYAAGFNAALRAAAAIARSKEIDDHWRGTDYMDGRNFVVEQIADEIEKEIQ